VRIFPHLYKNKNGLISSDFGRYDCSCYVKKKNQSLDGADYIKEAKNFITRRINCQTGASHFCFQQKQNMNESLFT